MAMTLTPFGIVCALSFSWIPKESLIEPASCLNFITSISEKDNKSTKKHSNKDIKSANVAIHAGAPTAGHFFSVSSSAILLYSSLEMRFLSGKNVLSKSSRTLGLMPSCMALIVSKIRFLLMRSSLLRIESLLAIGSAKALARTAP